MPEQEWTPRVRRVNSGGGRERLQYAVSLIREERLDEARDELLSILREDRRSIPARMMLGQVYLRQQMHSDALDEFKQAIAIDPLQVQPHVRAGTCCLRMNDIEQAKALFQTALDLDPKQVGAHFGMGQALAQSGQTEQALTHVEEALRLDPQMAPARMLLARLMRQTGNVDDAIEELSGFLNTNPDSAPASVGLAMMERRKGNNKKAIELLDAASKSNPESDRIWDLLGRTKMVVKDYAGAEKAFNEVINLKAQDRSAPLRLVDALVKQGKLEKAQDILKSIPRRGRVTSLVHQYYGDIYAAKRLYEDAVESYRAALLHMPDGERVLAEIDAAAGPGADDKAKIPQFQDAIAKLREEAIAKVREEGGTDREGLAQRRRANAGGISQGQRGRPGGNRPTRLAERRFAGAGKERE